MHNSAQQYSWRLMLAANTSLTATPYVHNALQKLLLHMIQ